ncbi:MAG TPA: hypothetical protein VD962_10530 [Rubricoccaceae bacterium]|nr:hypothetical protein [Rubricoccaceae bacterium]
MDDFHADDPFDDPFDDWEGGGFDAEGDGAPPAEASATAEMHRLLATGETGLRYDALVLFADPLFERYGLDGSVLLEGSNRNVVPDEGIVAVLQTARLLWAYFALPESERRRRRRVLGAHLLGAQPTEEDWADLDDLLDTVEPYWSTLSADEVAFAENTGHPVLGFDALVAHPFFRLEDEADAGYGPHRLPEVEARALFAQPLLETSEALDDADVFERAMDRANAYWVLAQSPEAERAARLEALVSERAGTEAEAQRLHAEAEAMVERFYTLFPERARAHNGRR